MFPRRSGPTEPTTELSGVPPRVATMTMTDVSTPPPDRRRRPALSPSRAGDFKQCPLLYRFRAVDRIPETPGIAQVRGTIVHAALERLYALPAAQRHRECAASLLAPAWRQLLADEPELAGLFDDADLLDSAAALVERYYTLEDPTAFEPESCELRVETELADGVVLRGFVDRIDVAPTGELRVVDYKTGAAPREVGEARALFQMKFYAVVLWRTRGIVPNQLRLLYLADGQVLTYSPDVDELARFERTLSAIWKAILAAGATGDFRPSPSRLCDWCDHKSRCPAFGGTAPPYPGWPDTPAAGEETAMERVG